MGSLVVYVVSPLLNSARSDQANTLVPSGVARIFFWHGVRSMYTAKLLLNAGSRIIAGPLINARVF